MKYLFYDFLKEISKINKKVLKYNKNGCSKDLYYIIEAETNNNVLNIVTLIVITKDTTISSITIKSEKVIMFHLLNIFRNRNVFEILNVDSIKDIDMKKYINSLYINNKIQ